MRVTETHKGAEKRIYVLLPGSKGVETTFHLWSVWHLIACAWRGLPGCVCMCVLCGVSLWLPWDRVRDRLLSGEEGRACDRLQWLVELSGQNMSDSADSMNHFGLQLCNLSPTLHHITASMWLPHARLKRSRLSRLLWRGRFEALIGEMLPNYVCTIRLFFTGRKHNDLNTLQLLLTLANMRVNIVWSQRLLRKKKLLRRFGSSSKDIMKSKITNYTLTVYAFE